MIAILSLLLPGPQLRGVTIPPSIVTVQEVADLLSKDGISVQCSQEAARRIVLVAFRNRDVLSCGSAVAAATRLEFKTLGPDKYAFQEDFQQKICDRDLRAAADDMLAEHVKHYMDAAEALPGGLDGDEIRKLARSSPDSIQGLQSQIGNYKFDPAGMLAFLHSGESRVSFERPWTWLDSEYNISQNSILPNRERSVVTYLFAAPIGRLTLSPAEKTNLLEQTARQVNRFSKLRFDPFTGQILQIEQHSLSSTRSLGELKSDVFPDAIPLPDFSLGAIYLHANRPPALVQSGTTALSTSDPAVSGAFELTHPCHSTIEAVQQWANAGNREVAMEFSPNFDPLLRQESNSSLGTVLNLVKSADNRIANAAANNYLVSLNTYAYPGTMIKEMCSRQAWTLGKAGGLPVIRCSYDFYDRAYSLPSRQLLALYRHSQPGNDLAPGKAKMQDVLDFCKDVDVESNVALSNFHLRIACPDVAPLHPYLCALMRMPKSTQDAVWAQLAKNGQCEVNLSQVPQEDLQALLDELRALAIGSGMGFTQSTLGACLLRDDALAVLKRGRMVFNLLSFEEEKAKQRLCGKVQVPLESGVSPEMERSLELTQFLISMWSNALDYGTGIGSLIELPNQEPRN